MPDGLWHDDDPARGGAGDLAPIRRDFPARSDGRRPVFGGSRKFQDDPHWRDHSSSTSTSMATTERAWVPAPDRLDRPRGQADSGPRPVQSRGGAGEQPLAPGRPVPPGFSSSRLPTAPRPLGPGPLGQKDGNSPQGLVSRRDTFVDGGPRSPRGSGRDSENPPFWWRSRSNRALVAALPPGRSGGLAVSRPSSRW